MCGIAGSIDLRAELSEEQLHEVGRTMADAVTHRGPNDSGTWVDAQAGVALGFRRLAIIDLTEAGHQPMTSSDGRYVLVFNGEIYNHRQLRSELGDDVAYRGHSDTEVMLAAMTRWGIREALRRFNGMFAFAVWDRKHRSLTLARDRMGEKPLYYGRVGGAFLFGSELKSLRAAPGFAAELDRDALTLFLRHGYIPAPHSAYRGIFKLLPGHLVEIGASGVGTPVPYWSATDAAVAGMQNPVHDEGEALERLESLLLDAVGLRMEADVPLGAFLSGGIDSSLVVALMQAQQSEPVRTFTIGFTEAGYDEAPHAKAVAAHLGTSHTELYVTPEQAQQVVPLLPQMYDEPFSDSSQIPTYLVSQLARRDVTVSLSGDGGDELFGGYSRYLLLDELWGRLSRTPLPVRTSVARGLRRVPAARWDAVFRAAGPVLPQRARQSHPGEKLHKLADSLGHTRAEQVYLQLVSLWQDPDRIVLGGREPVTPLTDPTRGLDVTSPALRAMHADTLTYLPDDILAKVDRAAMAVSLETRVPLLDHRLYELAWQLPLDQRIRGGAGKHLLRKVLHKYVPSTLVERPKMGFGVPIGTWLRGPMREWAESLLDESRLRDQGLLDPAPVRAAWAAHLSGVSDEKYRLWAVLSLQAWLAETTG